MKKIVLIIIIVFAVILGTLISVPIFFKKSILEKTKTTINKHLNAEVDFEGFKLSLFKNFPKVTIELQNVTVIGKGEFQTDTLLAVETAMAKMNLKSLFKKQN